MLWGGLRQGCEDELETLGMNRTMARRDSVALLKCDLIKVIMGIC